MAPSDRKLHVFAAFCWGSLLATGSFRLFATRCATSAGSLTSLTSGLGGSQGGARRLEGVEDVLSAPEPLLAAPLQAAHMQAVEVHPAEPAEADAEVVNEKGRRLNAITDAMPSCLVEKDRISRRMWPMLQFENYDCQTMRPFLQQFAPNAVVVEVGAFNGEYFHEYIGLAKKVYAFEPTPMKAAKIKRTIEKKNLQGLVDFYEGAVSDKSGTDRLYLECAHWTKQTAEGCNSLQDTLGAPPPWRNQDQFQKFSVNVSIWSIDDLRASGRIQGHINLVKADTQGHEWHVLKGMERTLREDPPDYIHFEFSPKLVEKNAKRPISHMLDLMYGYGYQCFDCAAFHRVPPTGERNIDRYHLQFPGNPYDGGNGQRGDHGTWTDILCVI